MTPFGRLPPKGGKKMVDRINPTHEGEIHRPQTSQAPSSKQIKTENAPIDELIAALASARENRRARQVTEWERLYQTRRIST